MSKGYVSLLLADFGKILKEIHTSFVPANDEVVGNGHDPSSSDGVVCTNIRDNVDLGSDGHI